MPVEDHPIHPSTQKGANYRYGCWNRGSFAAGYYAPDRVYRPDGTFYTVQTFIRHATSTDCKYDKPLDPTCEGCAHVQKPEASGGGEAVSLSKLW